MRRSIKTVLSVFLAAAMVMGATGCDTEKKQTITAYQIAVQNGFVGTEQEWLESLKGADGKDAEQIRINDLYEAAKAEGYEGSFLEFLKEYLQLEVTPNNDTTTIAENMFSVVSINCGFTKTVTAGNGWLGSVITKEEVYASAGSGVIIDVNKQAGNATIITNYHVIYDYESNTETGVSDEIYVYPYGAFNGFSSETGKEESGEGIKARYVGGAMDYDIAILKIEGSEYIRNNYVTAARLGDSDQAKVGEKVYAIGNPGNAGISVTSGVVSVDSEYIMMYSSDGKNREVIYRVMRTDAAINSGNSGGALFNAYGDLIGITNAKSTGDGVDNLCYALPITSAQYLWENILDNGGVLKRATLGIVTQQIDSSASLENGVIIKDETNIIKEVVTGSIAYGKLKVGDTVESVTVGGVKTDLSRRYYLNDLLLSVRKGDTIQIGVIRDGSAMEVSFTFDKDEYFTVMS